MVPQVREKNSPKSDHMQEVMDNMITHIIRRLTLFYLY